MTTQPRAASAWPLMTVILVVAFALRLYGLTFGLPAVYNPDEVAIMNRALALPQNGFNPHNFLYPSLYFYVLVVAEGAWFLVGRVTGVFESLAAFERSYFVDPSSIYVVGRAVSAVAGTVTVWFTWRLGVRLFGRGAGIVAALLLALAPLAVRDAHYVKHDVPVTLLIVAAHLVAAGTLREASTRRDWLLAGAVAGLALSTHYYALFVLVPLAGLATAQRGDRTGRLLMLVAAAATAFALTSPFLFLELGTTIRDVVANRQIVVDRATTSGGAFASLWYYLTWLARDGVGPGAAVLAAAGVLVTVGSGWPRAVLVLGFPVVFLLFLANTVPASRYLNPVVPFVAVLAGAAVSWCWTRPILRYVAMVAVAGAGLQSAAASLHVDRFISRTDTRTQAAAWMEREIPSGASVLIQPYSVPIRQSRASLVEALTATLGDPSRASVRFQRQLAIDPAPAPSYRTIYLGSGGLDVDKIYLAPSAFDEGTGLAPLRQAAVTYVVLKRYNVGDPSLVSFTRALEREGHRLTTFSPYAATADARVRQDTPPFLHNTDVRMGLALERPGPIIEIWRVD